MFQDFVIRVAGLYGWKAYHTYDSRKSIPGWPDLVLSKPGYPALIPELKTKTGVLTPDQVSWVECLRSSTYVLSGVWRPADQDRIVQALGLTSEEWQFRLADHLRIPVDHVNLR